MADLRRFQQQSQSQANLGAIPTAQPAASPGLALAGFATQLGSVAIQAAASGQQAEADAAQAKQLGDFTTQLSKLQQRGQTDPRFKTQQAQRQLFTEMVAANPSLSGELTKIFTDATGLKPAGLTQEQQAIQKQQNEAWDNGFGSPLATPEENAKQLELYMDIQREAVTMEHESKVAAANKQNIQDAVYKRTAKLAALKTESVSIALDGLMQNIANGGSRAEAEMQWLKIKTQWANEMGQFGEFVNDPVVKAQVSGVQQVLEAGDRFIRGEADLNEAQKETQIAIEKQKNIVAGDPKNAHLIAVSNLFGNNPAITTVAHRAINALVASGPTDLTDTDGNDKKVIRDTLDNMGGSEDPAAKEEAAAHVTSVAAHLERNGMDYTDDNILEVCSTLAAPKAFGAMTNDQKSVVASACEVYAADVAGKAIREIEMNGSVSIPTETITPRGTTQPGPPNVIPVEQFADMEVTDTGLMYVSKPEFRNNRQVQRQIQNLNRSLDKVNPVVTVYSSATGKSNADVARILWGIGPSAQNETSDQPIIVRPRGLTESDRVNPEDPAPVSEPVTQEQFREQFISAATAAGSSAEQAEQLWAQVSAPAVEEVPATVTIGDEVMTEEEAEELLSNPVQG